MSRQLTVAAAQMGPVQRADTRSEVVDRLIAMLRQAHEAGATLVVFPELALTTFFPRWVIDDAEELDGYFESEMPNNETQPLFEAARELEVGFHLGYAEMQTEDDGSKRYFNTAILVDRAGRIAGKYRKVHIPGHAEPQPGQVHQHLEKRYFEPGRPRLPRVPLDGRRHGDVHLQRPALARDLPGDGAAGRRAGYARLQHAERQSLRQGAGGAAPSACSHNHLSMQAGAYQNGTWVVARGQGRHGGRHPPHGRKLRHRAHRRDRGPGPGRGRTRS